MPNSIPTVLRDQITNYPPALAQAFIDAFNQGIPFWLALPITFSTADAAVLFTVPAGQRLFVHRALWEVAVDFTGGAASAIGVSATVAPYNTKGDLLGGAAGDVLATLTAGLKGGTLGTDFGSNGVVVLPAASSVRFDRITSAFTAGSGFVHIQASLLPVA